MSKPDTGVVNIHGKQYQTVALRVATFREKYPDHSLLTEVLQRDEKCVVMQARIVAPDGRTIATGHAEEYRSTSQINRTSALENAETSAIGRALAGLGYGGTEFASADEVARAVSGQKSGVVISPVKEAAKGSDVDMDKAGKIAAEFIDLFAAHDSGDTEAEYRVLENLESMDNEMKLAVWNELQAHSKVRTWVKKVQADARKATA